MDIKESWDNEDWVTNVKNILQWSSNIEQDKPMMLLLRHSHRETLLDHTQMASAGLTELGKQMSIEVGRRIPSGRPMDLYTSFVPRCFETAEGIAEGYSKTGGEIIDISPLPSLVAPQILEQDVWTELHPDGENVTEFVNRWVNGEFEGRMEPFGEYQVRFVEDTVKRLAEAKEKIFYIHVTHDLALMSAKRMLLERDLIHEDREPYLGGFGLITVDTGLELFIGSTNSSIMISNNANKL